MVAVTDSAVNLGQIGLLCNHFVRYVDEHLPYILSCQFRERPFLLSGHVRLRQILCDSRCRFCSARFLIRLFFRSRHIRAACQFSFGVIWAPARHVVIFLQFLIQLKQGDGESAHLLARTIIVQICIVYLDAVPVQKLLHLAEHDCKFRYRRGAKPVHKHAHLIAFCQARVLFDLVIHLLGENVCRLPFGP